MELTGSPSEGGVGLAGQAQAFATKAPGAVQLIQPEEVWEGARLLFSGPHRENNSLATLQQHLPDHLASETVPSTRITGRVDRDPPVLPFLSTRILTSHPEVIHQVDLAYLGFADFINLLIFKMVRCTQNVKIPNQGVTAA